MRVFKTKAFDRFARRERITDDALREAAHRADHGEIDADLGGGVIKQRIARSGEGKSGGFRTIILFRRKGRAFFVYGFSKADRASIRRDELHAFRALARELLGLKDRDLSVVAARGAIKEIE